MTCGCAELVISISGGVTSVPSELSDTGGTGGTGGILRTVQHSRRLASRHRVARKHPKLNNRQNTEAGVIDSGE
jgi:hypothetical protein